MIQLLIRTFIRDADNTTSRTVRTAYGNLACLVSVVCNLLLFAGKTAVGTLFGSVSITADGLNNLSDASSNIVSLIGFKLGSRPADSEHPYGHARYEYLAGLAVSVMILVIGVELFKESFAKTLDPTPVSFGWLTVVVLVASILVKLWMSHLNRTIGRRIDSDTLLATAADARNDVITTSVVLIAAVLTQVTGFARLDGLMGIAVSLFILYSGAMLVKDTIDPLLGSAPDPELVRHIEDKALSYPGVLGVHDLMIHDYGPGRQFASAHAEVPSSVDVMKSHDTIDLIERNIQRKYNLLISIHLDPIVVNDAHINSLRDLTESAVKEIDPALSIHDFRVVEGPTHSNLIFDVMAPPDFSLSDRELTNSIQEKLSKIDERYFCVITVDHSFN